MRIIFVREKGERKEDCLRFGVYYEAETDTDIWKKIG